MSRTLTILEKKDKPPLNDEEKQHRQRFYMIVGGFTVFLAIIFALLYWLTALGGDGPKKHELPERDAEQITERSQQFIEKAGNWGLDNTKISDDSMMNVWAIVTGQGGSLDGFYTDRQKRYAELRDSYINPGGDLYYSDSTLNNWNDSYAKTMLASFKVQGFTAKAPKNYFTVDDSDKTKHVTLPVAFDSVETMIVPTATDSAWDGYFNMLGKTFKNTAQLNFVKGVNDKDWMLDSITDLTEPFTLVSWGTPNSDYSSTQFGARKLKTYQGQFNKDYIDKLSVNGRKWIPGE